MSRDKKHFTLACIAGGLLLGVLQVHAQQTPAAAAPPPGSRSANFRCRHPADPHRRPRACNDEDFLMDETLAHGWDDVRQAMKRIGITPTASYVGAIQTNVAGGPDQVWSYAGQLSFAVDADLDELLSIPGLSAYVGASWGTGSDLAASLDATIPTSGLYAPSFYLGEMYLQEKLDKDKLRLVAGRLSAGNEFASLPVFNNYVSYGIDPNPYSLSANDITFSGPPPGTEWGAQVSYDAGSALQINAGIFNTNVKSANGEDHGADFALQEGNKGVVAIAEVDYLRNQRENSVGRPGQFTVGFLHANDSYATLSNPVVKSDGYNGAYLMAQQMIYRPGAAGTTRGATIWGTWTRNPKALISPVPTLWSVGATYEGLLPGRKDDVVSLAVLRAEGSHYGPPSNTAEQFELNYQWMHSRYLTITPHWIYLWQNQSRPNRSANVAGIQLALTL